MEIDGEQLLVNAMRDGIRDGIKSKMTQSYQNPFDDIIKRAIEKHGPALSALIADSIGALLANAEFRASIADQCRSILAKQLVQKFGGELEKQVNVLKSDPATRARITLAIESIVAGKA